MFDKPILVFPNSRDQHHHHHTEVHEHRAPTDDSVKLLREMEQAALDNILGAMRLEGCPVDAAVVHMRDPLLDEHKFIIRYKLGTTQREVRHVFRPNISLSAENLREEAVHQLIDALARDIAVGLLVPAIATMFRGKFPTFP
jgi:hypothetical protein